MNTLFIYILVFLAQELAALPLFLLIRKYYTKRADKKEDVSPNKWIYSVLKGFLERLVLYVGLVNDLPSVMTFFGAVKLGTRLDDDKKNRVSNDYFLVGNLVSVLLVVASYLFCKKMGY